MALKLASVLQSALKNVKPAGQTKPVQGSSHSRFGLNIGRSALVGCELTEDGSELVIENAGRKELTQGKSLSDQVKEFVKANGFASKQVRVSLKGQGIVVRYLNFPRMSRADFSSSIQYEAEKYLPFNLSEVVIDFHINDVPGVRSEGATTMPVILVAVRKTELNKLLDSVKNAGLEVGAVDLDTFACANAFERANGDAKGKVLGLVDFGSEDTTFMIWDKGALVFSRDIACGGRDALEFLKRKLSINTEQALNMTMGRETVSGEVQTVLVESLQRVVQELSLSLNYYYNHHQGTTPIEALYVSGGFSQPPLLIDLLRKEIEVEVKAWDPLAGIKRGGALTEENVKSLLPYLPVSVGLALRPGK